MSAHPGRLWAVMPAAGASLRFGAGLPKQYQLIGGVPVIRWSLAPLLGRSDVRGIVVALAADDEHGPRIMPSDPRVETTAGGSTRAASVACALAALADRAGADDWVIVHDAARPCLTGADLEHLIVRLADEPVGGLLAAPVSDTLKREEGGAVAETVDRQGLWRALTPQMFRYSLLRDSLAAAAGQVTDESSAIERAGMRPLLVAGRGDNIKVTTRDDLEQATAILADRS